MLRQMRVSKAIFTMRVRRWLDQGHGECILRAAAELRATMRQLLRHFDGDRYALDSFVVMPNHVHVLCATAAKPIPYPKFCIPGNRFRQKNKQVAGAVRAVWQDEKLRSDGAGFCGVGTISRLHIKENPVAAKLGDREFILEPERDAAGETPAGLADKMSAPQQMSAPQMFRAKKLGFSDRQLAIAGGVPEKAIRFATNRAKRHPDLPPGRYLRGGIRSLHAVLLFDLRRARMSARESGKRKIMILGGGPNRIGQGIEFDYCCVHAAFALRELGFETIMVNSNPETVSTDYDTSDKLYFEPLTLEDVLNIYDQEKPEGVIVQFGGQTPLNLADGLERGRRSDSRHPAGEHRDGGRSQALRRDARQARLAPDAERLRDQRGGSGRDRERIGYPVLVRPSFVLGGRGDGARSTTTTICGATCTSAVEVSPDRPVLWSTASSKTRSKWTSIASPTARLRVIGAIMEHIEQAGIHSGDSACVIPTFSLSKTVLAEISARDQGDGARAQRARPDERAVRGQGRRRLRARSQPARLAHGRRS